MGKNLILYKMFQIVTKGNAVVQTCMPWPQSKSGSLSYKPKVATLLTYLLLLTEDSVKYEK